MWIDRLDHQAVDPLVGLEPGDERAVDLDRADGVALERLERRPVGPDVVDGQLDAHVADGLEVGGGRRVDDGVLGHLDVELVAREARLAERPPTASETSPRWSCSTVQLTPSWMLRDQLQASSQAAATIHRVSGPMSPLASAAGIRRSGEMRPAGRMAPPHEGLHAEQPARGHVDDGQVLQIRGPLQGERRLRVGQHATRHSWTLLCRPRSGSVHEIRSCAHPSSRTRRELERRGPAAPADRRPADDRIAGSCGRTPWVRWPLDRGQERRPLAAAVGDQVRPAHVGGQGRGEEEADPGHVRRGAEPPERHGGGHRGHPGRPPVVGVGRLGGDQAGAQGVDPHPGRPLDGQGLRQAHQSGLRRAVGGGARRRPQAADRGDVDDRPAVLLVLHDGVGRLGAVERREQVQVDDGRREPRRRRGRVRVRRPPGVVHQHVQPAEPVDGGLPPRRPPGRRRAGRRPRRRPGDRARRRPSPPAGRRRPPRCVRTPRRRPRRPGTPRRSPGRCPVPRR